MSRKAERGFFELYRDDPERADALIFGRIAGVDRRGFLKGAGLAAMGAAVGGAIPYASTMPSGLIPAALAQGTATPNQPKILKMDGKADLVILGDKPLVCETPEHMLDDDVTPTPRIFIRNNGQIPEPTKDPDAWEIAIDGEVNTPLKLKLGEIKQKFQQVTYRMQMECGGNGRNAFQPEARGNQWGNGAISNAAWTGVRLADLLKAAGLKSSAVHTGHYGADPHLSGDATKPSISRGVPMAKALEEHTVLAFAVNGQPLPLIHGFPARLIAPGWPGSASQKWLTRIWVRDKEHDGPGMTGTAYRVPITPMVPGGKAVDANMRVLQSMPLRSIVTNVAHGTKLPAGTRKLDLRGQAWAGEKTVRAIDVSIDFGQTWTKGEVKPAPEKYSWQRWTAAVTFPSAGYYEVWARATDSDGVSQPFAAWNWNPQGYGGNSVHRVAVLVEA
jgi:DMSO/TMAO reductase YedYZ molybdopterin-dependent catalytic subunit